jgi:hypothetical protein
MEQLSIILIWTIVAILGTGLLWMMGNIIYTSIYPHECKIRYRRGNSDQIKNDRWKIWKDNNGNQFIKTTWKTKLKLIKPDEEYNAVLGKKKLYLDIIVPENGEPYAIKPNWDHLGRVISYNVADRDVIAWAKMDIRENIAKKYTFQSGMMQLAMVMMPLILALIFIIGIYYSNKTVNDNKDAAAMIAASNQKVAESQSILGVAINNIAISNTQGPGGSLNPLPMFNTNSSGGNG